ncbi:unnamed protein product, partial [marine sediment metagenome]
NILQSNNFEYLWDTIDIDTGATSGDTLEIIIRLTDIYSQNNEYHYYFEADFTAPTPLVSIGDGIQDFSTTPTNPFTDISFDDSLPEETELWNEPFTSYDSSYMSHSDLPDDYTNTWTMDPLYMYNALPTSFVSEDWSNWNLDYNSDYTISSFNSGISSPLLIAEAEGSP